MDNPAVHFKIVESVALVEQFRFPRSKKARIRNKWTKRDENWRPSPRVIVDARAGTIIVHPAYRDELMRTLLEPSGARGAAGPTCGGFPGGPYMPKGAL